MINHDLKFIFLHVPKTAGISIGSALYKAVGIEKEYGGYQIHYPEFNKNIWKEYFVFTFVRNPWDRFYSQYMYRDFLHRYLSFEYALKNFKELFEEMYGPFKKNYNFCGDYNRLSDTIYEHVHSLTQTEFLSGKYLDNIDKFPYINFIGRYESIESDFDYVCSEIGIQNTGLPLKNVSKPSSKIKSFKDCYTEELVQYASNLFTQDIKNFNYKFPLIVQ
tara:strand:+ start:18702 stop:19358 length:657 start_codon:yes stop_codon:yes gene_type:complete